MNVCLLLHDGFGDFEIGVALYQFNQHNVFSIALEDRAYKSEEGIKHLPDDIISNVNPDDIDLLIVPGPSVGKDQILTSKILRNFLNELNKKEKFIAAIEGGVVILHQHGILKDKKCTGPMTWFKDNYPNDELKDVVIDENIITANSGAFIEFGIELGKLLDIYKDKEEETDIYNWLKNIK